MVKISIDTESDSPQMIAKIIEMLHAHINTNQVSTVQSSIPSSTTNTYTAPTSQVTADTNPFAMFGGDTLASQNPVSSLPSSAPITNVQQSPVSNSGSLFDVFGNEDRPNSNPTPRMNQPMANKPAGFADDGLFGAFNNDLPSTTFENQQSAPSPEIESVYGTVTNETNFASAQSLLDDDFNPIQEQSSEDEPEEKSSNFFSFEKY